MTVKEAIIKAIKEHDAETAGKIADHLRKKGYNYNQVKTVFEEHGCTDFDSLMYEADLIT